MREQKQRFEPAAEREFHSSIPQHLLGKLSDSERYMVETMSKLENQWDWVRSTIMGHDRHIFDQDAEIKALRETVEQKDKEISSLRDKVKTLEDQSGEYKVSLKSLGDWKTLMSGKWAVVWALAIVVLSVLLKYLLDLLTKKGP